MRCILFLLMLFSSLFGQQFTTRRQMTVLPRPKMVRPLAGDSTRSVRSISPALKSSRTISPAPGVARPVKITSPLVKVPMLSAAKAISPLKVQPVVNTALNDSTLLKQLPFWKVKCGPDPEKPRAGSPPAQ